VANETRVGVAGLTHGHVWGLMDGWLKVEGARLIAVADETPLLDRAKDRFERSYTDWRNMLDTESLDALLVTSDKVQSSEIVVEALIRGIPCMVEKAMAANAIDADRMLSAMRRSGKSLMINWPGAWAPWLPELKRQLDAGRIGQAFHFRYRNGHRGPKEIGCDEWFYGWLYDEAKSGGGAITDFCSYGAVVSRWLFGMPESVICIRGNFTKDYPVTDDHAVILLKYPFGTAFLEGTWATVGSDGGPNPVVHGKTGTLYVRGNELFESETAIESPAIPYKSSADYFMDCVRSGRSPEGILNPEISADACRIIDAAIRSARTGCAESP
jgi:predicted dehydrogenase